MKHALMALEIVLRITLLMILIPLTILVMGVAAMLFACVTWLMPERAFKPVEW